MNNNYMQTEPNKETANFYCNRCWAMFAEECACFDDDEDDCKDEPDFTACTDCDGHSACEDFGCAYKLGLSHMVKKDPTQDW